MYDKKLFKIILVHCFNQGFLITVGRLDFKQSSANGCMRFTQLYYAHSQLRAVDQQGYYTCC